MTEESPAYHGEVEIAAPTHAGGIVVRRDGPVPRFLLVTARRQPSQWVFPKGHIEIGESATDAAVREVREEAGVDATVVAPIGSTEFRTARGVVRAQFYLMSFVAEGSTEEGRRRAWLTAAEAQRALPYEDARLLIARAAESVG